MAKARSAIVVDLNRTLDRIMVLRRSLTLTTEERGKLGRAIELVLQTLDEVLSIDVADGRVCFQNRSVAPVKKMKARA